MSMHAGIWIYFGVAGGFCCSPLDRSDNSPLLGVGGGWSRFGVGGGGWSRFGVGGGGGSSLFGGVRGGGSYWVPTEGLCSCWNVS